MKATAESGKLKFILLKNTLNYVLKAYPRARVFGELIANPAVKTALPKVRSQIAEVLGMLCAEDAPGSESHCSRGSLETAKLFLEGCSSGNELLLLPWPFLCLAAQVC